MRHLKRANPQTDADRSAVADTVARVLADIRGRGEAAVRHYSREFDSWDPEHFRVDDAEIERAHEEVPPELRESIDFAQAQVRRFAEAQRETILDLEIETEPGVVLGHRHVPVASVGCYVPGGRYSLIASSYMAVVPARVAGVERVVLATPPRDGRMSSAMLYAASVAGADDVYAIGGVQAVAAMAYGAIEGLDPVDMLVGPGNQYVVEAKRQLFGSVGIDLLAGPTEIGILADDSADPYVVAADLAGQAEHDPNSRAVLITTSQEVAQAVLDQIDDHISAVATVDVARQCWERGGEVVVADSLDELVELSDAYALEHVEIVLRDAAGVVERLRHYGSLFVGEEATVAYGDKVSGPNHILPTRAAARFSSGLWVGKFLKTVTFQRMDPEGSLQMARHCDVISTAEGMLAHARSAQVRLARYGEAAAAGAVREAARERA